MGYFRKIPVVIEAFQWWRNGDHPRDFDVPLHTLQNGVDVVISPAERKQKNWEGDVVRYFRQPGISGDRLCQHCQGRMVIHGWIDTLEGGHIVCPGDYVITGVKGEVYPVKPAIFLETYAAVPDDDPEIDAAKDKYEKKDK